MFNFLKKKKQKGLKDSLKPIRNNQEKQINIDMSKNNNFTILTLHDYYSIQDYENKMNEIDKLGIEKLLNLSVLWDSTRQKVSKGTYYIFSYNERLYNILINDEMIAIDERTPIGEHTLNRVIKFTLNDNSFSYFRCKLDENGSSYETRYYSTKGALIMELPKNEFNADFLSIISNLKNFKDIEQIIDLRKICFLVKEQHQTMRFDDKNDLSK